MTRPSRDTRGEGASRPLRSENSRLEGAAALVVHVQPHATKTEAIGWHGDAVKIRVKAPPVAGAANEELVRYLSRAVGVPRAAVRIVSGASTRRKRVVVEGVSRSEVLKRLGLDR